jgi:CRP/FNR family cyclic AMP-dependent transcriptional regulator
VRIAVRTHGGQELILQDIPAGGLFGDMAAIDGAPRSASVAALHRSRICRLPGAVFMALLAESPALARRVMHLLTARVREANARMRRWRVPRNGAPSWKPGRALSAF